MQKEAEHLLQKAEAESSPVSSNELDESEG